MGLYPAKNFWIQYGKQEVLLFPKTHFIKTYRCLGNPWLKQVYHRILLLRLGSEDL